MVKNYLTCPGHFSSVKDILGYSRNEIIGSWFGRFLTTDDLDKFETIRRTYCKSFIRNET